MADTLSSLQDLQGTTPPVAAPVYVQKIDKLGRAYATGKRKNAVARVWIKPGSGKITINGRAFEVYFARPVLRMILQQPLGVTKRIGQYDLDGDCCWRRPLGPGWRGSSWAFQGALPL